ncbi:rhamnan synthesis F family protein [Dyella sp.]|uniref:rhamnan synthesis F family protein n=1 Tax=Dyella sp. TaxID=1869338 RepID=UPI002ED2BBE3
MSRLTPDGIWRVFRDTVQRHGGGWTGIVSVIGRGIRVARALGMHGLLRRITASHERHAPMAHAVAHANLKPPIPADLLDMRIGIMIHMFYPDLAEEFSRSLSLVPRPFVLMISVVDDQAREQVQRQMQSLANMERLIIKVVANRGRDIAPMLLAFRDEILATDVFCHLHTKKSLYSGQEQTHWRHYLVDSLFGDMQRLAWILGMFQANPDLGLVYPESFRGVPLWGHTWLGNADWGRQLAAQLGLAIDTTQYLDFPAGSMFWARSQALRPLFELGLRLEAFPAEQGQTDGTLQHAIERMLGLVVRQQGLHLGILPTDGRLDLAGEGERNRHTYFQLPFAARLEQASFEARIISFDVFDTLVLRPFLEPAGARAYFGHVVQRRLGIADAARLRDEAEVAIRSEHHGVDPDLDTIYRTLAQRAGLPSDQAQAMQALELELEKRWLRPRQAVIDAMTVLKPDQLRIGVSDMYLGEPLLRAILPGEVTGSLSKIHVSCDTGWRKDDDQAWKHLSDITGIAPAHWLHVGDNEHADVQRPQALGFIHPVHVLRPSALFDVVPGLRVLRPSPQQRSRWQDQLWLGLVANHFSATADERPQDLVGSPVMRDPETFGYVVIGPLVVDYLAWLGRMTLARGARKLLFFSREGHLLERVFRRMQQAVPQFAQIQTHYLLVSRRGVNTAAIRSMDDLTHALGSSFTGTLRGLIETRLGADMANACTRILGDSDMQREVYLPDMRGQIITMLAPAQAAILEIAARERMAYLEYWNSLVEADEQVVVSDIGYAGSIQAQLSRLTERPLSGMYFALNASASQMETIGGEAFARFHDERAGDFSSPVMDHHLLLESILTAPHGQFSHFTIDEDRSYHAHFRVADSTDTSWETIKRIHDGIERFMLDATEAIGEDVINLDLDTRLVQVPLQKAARGRWTASGWDLTLSAEDMYTGRGNVLIHPA